MKKVLLIRRNYSDNIMWKQILSGFALGLCDVYKPLHIDIRNIDSDGTASVDFRGIHAGDFDRIIFLGTPALETMGDDATFACSEWEAALLAAFRLVKTPVLNRSLALAYNKLLQAPIPFCRQWEKQGWMVPGTRYVYADNKLQKFLTPSPLDTTCYLLYISTLDYFVWPEEEFPLASRSKFRDIIAETQREMWSAGYDLLVFQFFESGGDFYLFGHVSELPATVHHPRLAKLIGELVL